MLIRIWNEIVSSSSTTRGVGIYLTKTVALVKTPSASSTESSASGTHSFKSRNASSQNLGLARAPSATMTQPRPQYKTYDHHLLSPDDANFRPKGAMDLGAQSPVSASNSTPTQTQTPTTGSTATVSGSAGRSMFHFNRHHHHHHHHHRHLHLHDNRTKINGITELSPESVIEHIFNPYESHEESPFTYVAIPRAHDFTLESPPTPLRDDEEHHEHAPPTGEGEGGKNRLGGWRRKHKDKDKDKDKDKEKEKGKEKKDGQVAMNRTSSGIGSIGGASSLSGGVGGGGGGMVHSNSFVSQSGSSVSGTSRGRAGTGSSTPIQA